MSASPGKQGNRKDVDYNRILCVLNTEFYLYKLCSDMFINGHNYLPQLLLMTEATLQAIFLSL